MAHCSDAEAKNWNRQYTSDCVAVLLELATTSPVVETQAAPSKINDEDGWAPHVTHGNKTVLSKVDPRDRW